MRRAQLPLAILGGVLLGSVASYWLQTHTPLKASLAQNCGNEFSLINPWLRCEPEQNIARKKEFSAFKIDVQERIDGILAEGRANHVSLYVRDLQFGPWMGINEMEEYSAASLLKSAVLLAVLKYAEGHPEALQQRVQITDDLLAIYAQNFPPARTVQAGRTYTIEELLKYMIIESDNNATNTLHAYLDTVSPGEPLFLISMEELGLLNRERLNDDSLTVKQAASIFRQLYNSSYLSKESSQWALELLERSSFNDAIVAGVPSGVTVAHKFGERRTEDGGRQLHDCGIVYHPGGDYLLCIMTQGYNSHVQAGVIAELSKIVYDEMTLRSQLQ